MKFNRENALGVVAHVAGVQHEDRHPGPAGHVRQQLLVTARGFKADQSAGRQTVQPSRAEEGCSKQECPLLTGRLKVIGGFRAVGGSQAFCVIRSVWEICKLNGFNGEAKRR